MAECFGTPLKVSPRPSELKPSNGHIKGEAIMIHVFFFGNGLCHAQATSVFEVFDDLDCPDRDSNCRRSIHTKTHELP